MESGRLVAVDVLANDSDPDGESLVLEEAWLPLPEAGTAWVAGGKVKVRAAEDFVGSVVLTYRIADPRGGKANGQLSLEVVAGAPKPPPVTNTKPVAVDDDVVTGHGQPVVVDVLANDTDPDGDPLQVTHVGRPKHGTASLSGASITYTPSPNFSGTDKFKYTIVDSHGRRSKAWVSVEVAAAPEAQPPAEPPAGAAPTRSDVEKALSRLGLPTGAANGHYDAKTRRALCTWRTVTGRHASRRLPSATEARAILETDHLPGALGSMVTGLNISKTCQAAFWVSSADNYRAIMPATTGKPGYATRSGVHHVFIAWHVWRYSTIYEGARMYKPMQFSGGQAVHGSAHDSYVKTHPASHGCVRMLHRDIDRLQSGGFGLGSAVRVFGAW